MGTVLDIFARAPFGPALLGWMVFGLVWQVVSVGLLLRKFRLDAQLARKLEALTRNGKHHKARTRAYESSQALAPLTATLSGNLAPDLYGPPRPLVALTLAVAMPLIVVVGVALVEVPPESRLALALAHAVLTPSTLLAGRVIGLAQGHRARVIRACAFAVFERNARRLDGRHIDSARGDVDP